MDDLPNEIKLMVVSKLDVIDVLSLSRVNKKWRSFCMDPDLWSMFFKINYDEDYKDEDSFSVYWVYSIIIILVTNWKIVFYLPELCDYKYHKAVEFYRNLINDEKLWKLEIMTILKDARNYRDIHEIINKNYPYLNELIRFINNDETNLDNENKEYYEIAMKLKQYINNFVKNNLI